MLVRNATAEADEPAHPQYVTMGGPSEANEYLRHNEALWRQGKGEAFLRRVLQIGPFADRLERLLAIERELRDLPHGDERSRRVGERFALFGDDAIPSIVTECEPLL